MPGLPLVGSAARTLAPAPGMGAQARACTMPSTLHRRLRQLAAAESIPMRITGGCMEPAMRDGARVSVARQRLYWPGDVLVFAAADGRLTAHRLIGAGPWRGRWRLFTRADTAPAIDTAILAADVVGRVVGGDCAPAVARVHPAQRLRSLAFFLRYALTRLLGRGVRA